MSVMAEPPNPVYSDRPRCGGRGFDGYHGFLAQDPGPLTHMSASKLP